MLINVGAGTSSATGYVDLVSIIEDHLAETDSSVQRGSYDGVFATCTEVQS